MATAESQLAANEERRRSERLPLALPFVVRGESLGTNAFQEETFTLSVSAHGALLALAKTVTLGQRLILRNPQTQDEVEAWVTRLGVPRGGLPQVGIELVRPDANFWLNQPGVKARTDGAEQQGLRALPHPGWKDVFEVVSPDRSEPGQERPTSQPGTRAPAGSPAVLLNALEKTLRQAADQAVETAATAHLDAAVNRAAAVVRHYSEGRVQQIEERLNQYRAEMVASARQDFLSQLQADVAGTEEHLRTRAEEFVGDAARKASGDLVERLREASSQAVERFVEGAESCSAECSARLAGQMQTATSEAQTKIEATVAGFKESEEKARGEMERTVAETQQRVESMASRLNETYAECEARLRAFQQELAHSKEQEVDHFRERLRNVLALLLDSLK